MSGRKAKIKRILVGTIGLLMIVCMAGCSAQAEETGAKDQNTTIEFTDVAGREIKIDQTAKRVVDCTGLGGTRIMIQLQAQELLVGATDSTLKSLSQTDIYGASYQLVGKAAPELKSLPSIGTYNEPNLQTIISLDPDLILIGWGGPEQAESIQSQTGITTVCIGRMDGNFDTDLYEMVGKAVGKEDRAKELSDYLDKTLSVVTDVTDKISEKDKKSLYFWIVPQIGNPPRSNGVYEAFDYAGGINVASTPDGKVMYETSNEQIAVWNPEYIFLQYRNMDNYYTLEKLKEDPILGNVDAVKEGKVYNLRGPISDWDTAIEATETIYVAKLLYPERFKDLNVEELGNEILEKFYGVAGLYTEMAEFSKLYTWTDK